MESMAELAPDVVGAMVFETTQPFVEPAEDEPEIRSGSQLKVLNQEYSSTRSLSYHNMIS